MPLQTYEEFADTKPKPLKIDWGNRPGPNPDSPVGETSEQAPAPAAPVPVAKPLVPHEEFIRPRSAPAPAVAPAGQVPATVQQLANEPWEQYQKRMHPESQAAPSPASVPSSTGAAGAAPLPSPGAAQQPVKPPTIGAAAPAPAIQPAAPAAPPAPVVVAARASLKTGQVWTGNGQPNNRWAVMENGKPVGTETYATDAGARAAHVEAHPEMLTKPIVVPGSTGFEGMPEAEFKEMQDAAARGEIRDQHTLDAINDEALHRMHEGHDPYSKYRANLPGVKERRQADVQTYMYKRREEQQTAEFEKTIPQSERDAMKADDLPPVIPESTFAESQSHAAGRAGISIIGHALGAVEGAKELLGATQEEPNLFPERGGPKYYRPGTGDMVLHTPDDQAEYARRSAVLKNPAQATLDDLAPDSWLTQITAMKAEERSKTLYAAYNARVAKVRQEQPQLFADELSTPGELLDPQKAAATMTQGIGEFAPALLAGVLGGGPALAAVMFVDSYGSTFDSLVKSGVRPEDANKVAVLFAPVSTAMMMLPAGKAVGGIQKALLGQFRKDIIGKAAAAGFKGAGEDAFSWALKNLGTDVLKQSATMAGIMAMQGAYKEGCDAAILGRYPDKDTTFLQRRSSEAIMGTVAFLPMMVLPSAIRVAQETVAMSSHFGVQGKPLSAVEVQAAAGLLGAANARGANGFAVGRDSSGALQALASRLQAHGLVYVEQGGNGEVVYKFSPQVLKAFQEKLGLSGIKTEQNPALQHAPLTLTPAEQLAAQQGDMMMRASREARASGGPGTVRPVEAASEATIRGAAPERAPVQPVDAVSAPETNPTPVIEGKKAGPDVAPPTLDVIPAKPEPVAPENPPTLPPAEKVVSEVGQAAPSQPAAQPEPKFFTNEAAAVARARLAAKAKAAESRTKMPGRERGAVSVGPEDFKDLLAIGGNLMERKIIKLAKWAAEMAKAIPEMWAKLTDGQRRGLWAATRREAFRQNVAGLEPIDVHELIQYAKGYAAGRGPEPKEPLPGQVKASGESSKTIINRTAGTGRAEPTVTEPQALAASMKAQEKAGFKAGVAEGRALEAAPTPETVKQRINRTTGMTDESGAVTEADALAASMKGKERAAATGYRAGTAQAVADVGDLADYAKALLPNEQFYKVRAALDNVKTPGQRAAAVESIVRIADAVGHQQAVGELQGLAKKLQSSVKDMPEELRGQAAGILDTLPGKKITQETREAIQGLIGRAESGDNTIAAKTLKDAKLRLEADAGKQYGDMTAEEINQHTDAIRGILGHMKVLEKVALADKEIDHAGMVNRLIDGLNRGREPATNPLVKALGKIGKSLTQWASGMTFSLQKTIGRDLGREIIYNLSKAQGEGWRGAQYLEDGLAKVEKDTGYKLAELDRKPFCQVTGKDGQKITLTVGQAINLTGMNDREIVQQSLFDPRHKGLTITGKNDAPDLVEKLGPGVIQRIAGNLKKSQYGKVYEELHDLLNSDDYLAMTQKLHQREHGLPLDATEQKDYWPVGHRETDTGRGAFNAGGPSDPSFTKPIRKTARSYLLDGAGAMFDNHVGQWRNWGSRVGAMEFRPLWFDKAMQDAMGERFGKSQLSALNDKMKSVLLALQGERGKATPLLDAVLANRSMAKVNWSATTHISHFVSFEAMTPKYLENQEAAKKLTDYTHSPEADEVKQDPRLIQRWRSNIQEITGTDTPGALKQWRQTVNKTTGRMTGIRALDERGATQAIKAFLEDGRLQGMDHDQRIEYARRQINTEILETQPGQNPLSQSYATLPNRRSDLMRGPWQWLSASSKENNLLAMDVNELYRDPSKENTSQLLRTAIGIGTIKTARMVTRKAIQAALTAALVGTGAAMSGLKQDWGKEAINETIGGIPLASDAAKFGEALADPKERMPNLQVFPLSEAEILGRSAFDIKHLLADVRPALQDNPDDAKLQREQSAILYRLANAGISLAEIAGIPSGTPAQAFRTKYRDQMASEAALRYRIKEAQKNGDAVEVGRLKKELEPLYGENFKTIQAAVQSGKITLERAVNLIVPKEHPELESLSISQGVKKYNDPETTPEDKAALHDILLARAVNAWERSRGGKDPMTYNNAMKLLQALGHTEDDLPGLVGEVKHRERVQQFERAKIRNDLSR
jgi:hypothetical protein